MIEVTVICLLIYGSSLSTAYSEGEHNDVAPVPPASIPDDLSARNEDAVESKMISVLLILFNCLNSLKFKNSIAICFIF